MCVSVGEHYMKTYRELEVKLHVFLALDNPLYDWMVL
jgi:hypothetical protein